MSTTQLIIWYGLIAVGLIGSALFSGLETGVYSLNRVRLHLLAHQGEHGARAMARMLAKPGAMLAALLVSNNICNNLAASAMAVVFEAYEFSQWQIIGLSLLIVTPMLFVFAETLPKDLFAAHADKMVYPFARPMAGIQRLLTWVGVLPLLSAISNGVMWLLGERGQVMPFHPRLLVTALVKEGVGHGLLSDEQSAIVDRVLALAHRTVADDMVPWDEVETVSLNATPFELRELANSTSRSRFPVVDDAGKLVGVISLYDVLRYKVEACPPVADLLHQPQRLPAATPHRVALNTLRRAKVAIAIVTDDREQPLGVITMKDLVQPITGELSSW